MTQIGMGTAIHDLRKRIMDIESDIALLGAFEEYPELIDSTNLLRSNEYLVKKSGKQAELTVAYEQYSRALEELLANVFEIQTDLKDILKEQSRLMSDSDKTRRARKSTSKTTVKSGQRRRQLP